MTTEPSPKPTEAERLHQEACDREENTYKDPDTGYKVLTRHFLEKRGHCCLCNCRHCPYERD